MPPVSSDRVVYRKYKLMSSLPLQLPLQLQGPLGPEHFGYQITICIIFEDTKKYWSYSTIFLCHAQILWYTDIANSIDI